MNNKTECLKRFSFAQALLLAAVVGDRELVAEVGKMWKEWPNNPKLQVKISRIGKGRPRKVGKRAWNPLKA